MFSIRKPGLLDVLKAPAYALSAKQILVMTFFLCLGMVVYDIFVYLAYLVDGQNLGTVFRVFGFFPFGLPSVHSWFAWLIYVVGFVLTILSVMLGFFGVAAINIEQIRGNRFMSWSAAIRFSFSRFGQLFLAELAVALFVALIIGLFVVLGLVARIPVVGEWIYALFFAIPNFVIALLTVFVIFVFSLSVILLPAVSAAEHHGEAFGVIVETFSTIIRQPLRWFGYTIYAVVAAKLSSFVYAYFSFRAIQFLVGATMLGGGDGVYSLVKGGLSHLPANSEFVRETFNVFPGIDWSFSVAYWMRGGSNSAAGYLMAVMIFLIFASVIGYFFATIAAGQACGFASIRIIKDEYNIAEESPMFFTDEHVNPVTEGGENEEDSTGV